MHVLVTGHTGFKGAWLTLLLHRLGHQVSGFALDPEPQSLFQQARVYGLMAVDTRAYVRDIKADVLYVLSRTRKQPSLLRPVPSEAERA
jgi:CDP-glucose 4,6-dehydratase